MMTDANAITTTGGSVSRGPSNGYIAVKEYEQEASDEAHAIK